jgi:uncharacterized membrane protein
MQLTPLIAVHMTAAIGAVVIGPFALWARMGSTQRPWLHRVIARKDFVTHRITMQCL